MTDVTRSGTSWPAGFTVRPTVDPGSGQVEVSDTVSGRRFRWQPEALAERILTDGTDARAGGGTWARAQGGADREHLLPGWRHWLHRGWHPSDQSYVASRRWAYADTDDPGDHIRRRTVQTYLDTDGLPPQEELPDAPVVPLGSPATPGDQPVGALLASRRSGRAYVPRPVPLPSLSGLLWHGLSGVRERREATGEAEPLSYLDSFGSAWDYYVCVYSVEGLEPGAYRYDVSRHELRLVSQGDHRAVMTDVLQGMRSPATAAWTIGLVADFPRYQWRYRHEHALRRLWFEAGLIGQEVIVLGSSYGLSTLVTPAQKDRPYLRLHSLDDRRYACLYTLTMGLSRGRTGMNFNGTAIEQTDIGA
ncbi:SagB/ThcOx family dehydrogenase [Streptomyces sp. NPDC088847]|uniref:SagB/ThcOx family dehydrogenase n=1 Tax=Streptomyces sp. NPDC088847 TaxID=3365909 RepID=UPI0037F4E88F